MPIFKFSLSSSFGGFLNGLIGADSNSTPVNADNDSPAVTVRVDTAHPTARTHPASCVSGLLRSGGPAAIIRRVAFDVIDALNSQVPFSDPHIIVERSKRIAPSIANKNASTGIVWVSIRMLWVASIQDAKPYAIFCRFRHSVSCFGFANFRALCAAARGGVTRSKVTSSHDSTGAARAGARPQGGIIFCRPVIAGDGPFSENLSSNVFNSWWYTFISHFLTPSKSVVRGLPVVAGGLRTIHGYV